jgi:mannosylglycoprotein endo-beta-mannosidase
LEYATFCWFSWWFLVGVDADVLEVISWEVKSFSVGVVVKNRSNDCILRIVTVYGSPYEEGKQAFISELHELFLNWQGPTMIGGDFNLVRSQSDKSNGNVDFRWVDRFNAWVDLWSLIEIGLTGRTFTWSNNQENRIMSKIDRIFVSNEFEALFPLATARALPRIGSDHTPIVWDSGIGNPPKKSSFKFEKWWLSRPNFKDIVIKAWSVSRRGMSSLEWWQAKVRYFRKLVKGWSANIDAEIRKHKELMQEYDLLDTKAELQSLSVIESNRLEEILRELSNFWVIEETKAKQRARDRDIVEGDRNTAYFHAVANQRRRKKQISVLDGPSGPVTEVKDMLNVATDYYKDLFSWEARPDIRLDQDFFSLDEKVTREENDSLDCRFTLEEIREAVFGSYADGAPGPDGLSFMFYQKFWDVIKFDLLEMFDDWFEDKLDIYRLNFAMITLIPKEEDARSMKKFRPISLLNCSFKIFTKAVTKRYAKIMNRLISQCQFAFIRGRFILESVVTAHEVIHEIHSKKEQGLVFKIDYEKAYD